MFEAREVKILRLALCPSAGQGEIESAAVRLIRSLRRRGATVESIIPVQSSEGPNPGEVVMPIGKYKGWPIREIPEHYLAWFCREVRTHPRLVRIIRRFLTAEDVAGVVGRI